VQNIDDYLKAKDWTYSFEALEGSEYGYSWIKTKDTMIDPMTVVTLPSPFRIIVLDYALAPGAEAFGDRAGWTKIGDYALSPAFLSAPDLPLHEASFIIYEPALAPQMESMIGKEQLYCHREIYEEELPLLSQTLARLKIFLYLSTSYDYLLITSDQTMAEIKQSEQFLSLPQQAKEKVLNRRDRQWRQFGPEVGPELCSEEGCERKRIQLTSRCFIHQMQMQSK